MQFPPVEALAIQVGLDICFGDQSGSPPFHERFNLCKAIPHHLGFGLVISGAVALVPPISQGMNGKPRHLGHFFVSEPLRPLFHVHFLQSKKRLP